jgi:hypothetical protein
MNGYYKKYTNNTGHTIQIQYDEECPASVNPMNWDTVFNYYTWERNYNSMQEHSYREVDDWFDAQVGEYAYYRLRDKCQAEGKNLLQFLDVLCSALDKVGIVAFPILSYEHSGISYYLGNSIDRFDGRVSGFSWQYKEELYKEYGCKRITKFIREKLEKNVKSTLETYTQYCNGEVYDYVLYDCNGIEIDSCCGFYANTDEELLSLILEHIPSDIADIDFVEVTKELQKAVA